MIHSRLLPTLAGLMLATFAGAAEEPVAPPTQVYHYALLEQALWRYQQLAQDRSLTQLPALSGRSVKPGEEYAGASALRRLLAAVGDLPAADAVAPAAPATLATPTADADAASIAAPAPSPDTLDDTLVAGLKRFQERHGLDQDGVLGPGTWRALTTPLSSRVRQIQRTMQRWQSLPPNPYRRAIYINIPRFRLYATDGTSEREADWLQINVVVGKAIEDLHTPTFSSDMTHVIVRPYWDVPRSIARNEIVPAARRDPGYFARHHYELVDGAGRVVGYSAERLQELAAGTLRVRQRPGEDNSLGAVKFMLPNPYNVYLHDTPSRSLFAQATRAYSHGCIRVSDPVGLAQWVLKEDPSWTPERIAAAMAGTQPLTVNLAEPIKVYIVYGTAIAREDGSVLFLNDIYGLEK